MLLAQNDGPNPTISHPFLYARVLGIYHANVIFTGPESRDYQSRCFEFLWVQWFELLEPPSTGFKKCALDKGRFIPMHRTDVFGFVDPADVLRSCHLIPVFADDRQHLDGATVSQNGRNADDWKYYYINQYLSVQIVIP